MRARLIAAAACAAMMPVAASAETPYADRCDGNVCYQAKVQMGCMTSEARALMRTIAGRFGKIEIASACDGRHARRSAHYVGKAFDFRPYQANRAEVVAFLKESPHVGGVGTYSNGLIHADVGDRKMAWHGRGGRAWPIGVDRAVDDPIQVASADASGASGAFATAFLRAFKPMEPVPGPADGFETVAPTEPATAKAASGAAPLPPSRPAFLALTATTPEAPAIRGPRDFAAVLRGPLEPPMPVLVEEAASEGPEETKLAVSFYRDDPSPSRARMIALARLR